MSSLPPRPKPWETKTSSDPAAAGPSRTTPSAFDNAVASSSTSNLAPQIPERPANLGQADLTTGGYGAMQSSYRPSYGTGSYGMGMSSYGGLGGMGGLGGLGGMGYGGGYSSYNRFGGGYGGGMGYGGGYGGMGGYGVGGMGGPGEGYPTLTSSLQATTAPAFAILESLVTAFTSLAQLVESTYMATHSSFFAMVGVADQLGSLKSYLGQVLGVFSILRLGRKLLNWLRGRKASTQGWVNEWAGVAGGTLVGPGGPGVQGGSPEAPRPSSKPLLLFLLSAVGLPYLMSRLIKLLIAHTQAQQQQQAQQLANGGVAGNNSLEGIDPSKLVFARAKWEFAPSEEWELRLGRDEIVAVLEMRDPAPQAAGAKATGEDKGWWRGRTRDGRVGWFPGNYVEVIKRRENPPV